jgi:hypothetical protein
MVQHAPHATCTTSICPWCVFLPLARATTSGKQRSASGRFWGLSVKLSANHSVRQPGLGTNSDTLSGLAVIHPFDGHRVEHPKFGRWAFTGKSQKVGRFVRRWRMEQICAMIQKWIITPAVPALQNFCRVVGGGWVASFACVIRSGNISTSVLLQVCKLAPLQPLRHRFGGGQVAGFSGFVRPSGNISGGCFSSLHSMLGLNPQPLRHRLGNG